MTQRTSLNEGRCYNGIGAYLPDDTCRILLKTVLWSRSLGRRRSQSLSESAVLASVGVGVDKVRPTPTGVSDFATFGTDVTSERLVGSEQRRQRSTRLNPRPAGGGGV